LSFRKQQDDLGSVHGSVGGPPAPNWQAEMVAADSLTVAWANGAAASYELQMAAVGAAGNAALEEKGAAREVKLADASFREVYAGPAQSFLVAPLARDSAFASRVRALDAQREQLGEWSPAYAFRTLASSSPSPSSILARPQDTISEAEMNAIRRADSSHALLALEILYERAMHAQFDIKERCVFK
jgi:hypothetical protein